MNLSISPRDSGFGAVVHGIRLNKTLSTETVAEIRKAWVRYGVLVFPDQPMEHSELTSFASLFGPFGHDPFVQSLQDYPNILEVRREPGERVSPFGHSWHSDWSFQASPPSATLLHAKVVPPFGGNTLYADGARAYDKLPVKLQQEIGALQAIHSARRPYSPEGFVRSGGTERSMHIVPDNNAYQTQLHPIVRTHPESGRKVLWINPVYTIGIHGIPQHASDALLSELLDHALKPDFIYEHTWEENMLTMWDNRTVQHCAQGGYDGHLRVMHRTTIAGDRPQ